MLSAYLRCQAEADLASFITLLSEDKGGKRQPPHTLEMPNWDLKFSSSFLLN